MSVRSVRSLVQSGRSWCLMYVCSGLWRQSAQHSTHYTMPSVQEDALLSSRSSPYLVLLLLCNSSNAKVGAGREPGVLLCRGLYM